MRSQNLLSSAKSEYWITRRNLCLISNKNSNNTSWKFWHYVLCFAIVRNLVGSLLPPSSCQRQNIFSRISKLSRSKNRKKPMRSLFFSVSVVFAFADSRAWNATVGIDGEWRKLVYSQTASIPTNKSWKDWNQQKGYSCFCKNRNTGIYWWAENTFWKFWHCRALVLLSPRNWL